MQLSQKEKTFSEFSAAFLNFRLNFNKIETKYVPHRFCNFEITDSENVVREMSKKPHLREPFEKQHGKLVEALLKSASEHLVPIH